MEINTEAIQTFLNDKRAAGLSWWTRNDLKGILSGIFTKAGEWGYWNGDNPTGNTSLGPKRYARTKFGLADEQIVSLLNELEGDAQLMLATVISTGARIAEVCGVKRGSVDVGRGWLKIQESYYRGEHSPTKTSCSERVVSLGMLATAYGLKLAEPGGIDDYVSAIRAASHMMTAISSSASYPLLRGWTRGFPGSDGELSVG